MGKSFRPSVLAHLDQDKLDLLDEFSTTARIPRAVLIREAIDDLIEKHRSVWKLAAPKRPTARNIQQARLARAAKSK